MTEAMDGAVYMGFVFGVTMLMRDEKWLDIPKTAIPMQWYALVGKYLDDHPEEWNVNAERSVYRALYAVWPGPNKSPQ